MFGMSFMEIGVILLITLVVLGPEKLPQVARTAGKTLREVRRAGNMLRDALMEADKPRYKAPTPITASSYDPYVTAPHDDHAVPDGDPYYDTHTRKKPDEPQRFEVHLAARTPPQDGASVEVAMRPAHRPLSGAEREAYLHSQLPDMGHR
ncbi:MAG: twin-arginine translocase TatA/TatE family subunit [Myxococcota bacterium]